MRLLIWMGREKAGDESGEYGRGFHVPASLFADLCEVGERE